MLQRKFLRIDGQTIAYVQPGPEVSCVFLHGLGLQASADQWTRLIDRLPDGFEYLALDMLGWGLSSRPTDEFSFDRLLGVTAAVIDASQVKDLVLVGHTLGGWLSVLLAVRYPELVSRLVLVNPAGLNKTPPIPAGSFTLPDRDGVRAAMVHTYGDPALVIDEMVDEEVRRTSVPEAQASYSEILRWINDPDERNRYSLEKFLPNVTQPTTIIWGTDDQILGVENGRRAVELLPNAELVLIERGGHIPMIRTPELVAEHVLND